MLAYLLKCGMRYISDFSLGAVKCDYAGVRGTSEISGQWKEKFAEICATRAKDIQTWDFDQELVDKIYESFEGAHWVLDPTNYIGVDDYFGGGKDMYTLPPASSIAVYAVKWQTQLDTYNALYVK